MMVSQTQGVAAENGDAKHAGGRTSRGGFDAGGGGGGRRRYKEDSQSFCEKMGVGRACFRNIQSSVLNLSSPGGRGSHESGTWRESGPEMRCGDQEPCRKHR